MLAGVVIALAGLAAYANTFSVPFHFDDMPSILDNPSIQHLWPIGDVLAPRPDYGFTVSGRPVLNLSLAICHAVSGTNVWSYHAFNLLIHVLAGLALLGIVRRTLLRPVLREGLGRDALPLALVMALLWTLHPLQTEAVTYLIQRTESLMGLFFLLTLYGFIRAVEAPRPMRWQVLTVLACLLGVGTKEVAATAPLLVLLYDRTFVAGSFREAWRRRRWLHLSLAATWIPLVALVSSTGWNRGGTAGFNVGISPWAYWFTQFEAVACYLKLAVWPQPLVFEYGTFWMGLTDAAPYALIVLPLAAATLVALWRWPVGGFLGAWFFAILAPTSLVPGTIQMIVEHRMYLPLAAVLALFVGSVATWCGRSGIAVLLVLAVAAGVITHQRNEVYRTDLELWQDTVTKRPGSANAQSNFGAALHARGRNSEALQHYELALQLNPTLVTAHYDFALALIQAGRLAEAAAHCRETFRLNPRYYPAHFQLGIILVRLDRVGEALDEFARTLEIAPWFGDAHYQWGLALCRMGRLPEAVAHHEQALRLDPDNAAMECGLGVALFQSGRVPEAAAHFERALKLNPKLMEAQFNLGQALAQMGQLDKAASHYAEAVRLDPNHAEAQINLGIALAQAGKLPEALAHLERAVKLGPGLPNAHCNLGIALAQQGRLDEAVDQYREALRLRPDYAAAHYNLGNALLALRRVPEARMHFEEAVRIDPRFEDAREMLNRLQAAESAGAAR
jgi:tetratricopeptide (TPR) repeat protein